MTAAVALAAAEAAGVSLWLQDDGAVRMRAAAPPPVRVLEDLRKNRREVVSLLEQRRIANFLLRQTEESLAVLGMSDDELDREREVIADGLAGGAPLPAADHHAALVGLLGSALQRPPAWSDPASVPLRGAWCGCCGWFSRRGGRWWREAESPSGWCCSTCHPAPPGVAVVKVET